MWSLLIMSVLCEMKCVGGLGYCCVMFPRKIFMAVTLVCVVCVYKRERGERWNRKYLV